MVQTYNKNKGINQGRIQNMNRELLLNLLRREGVCARIRLAELSGLKQATVTHIINDFIRWKLVREVGFLTGSKGRRSIGIDINRDDFAVLGIRIARKNYSVGLFDLTGRAVRVNRGSVADGDTPRDTFDQILRLSEELMKGEPKRRVLAIGMAIPGPFNLRTSRIELMTGVPGWGEVDIRSELEERFHIPVYMEQDGNAAVLAQEWHQNENADAQNASEAGKDDTSVEKGENILVYITAGQGVGAGILADGKVLRGRLGIAGEIGHTTIDIHGPRCACGNVGCLENYCSSIAFTRMVNEAVKPEKKISFAEAVMMVREGNEEAMKAFLSCCDALSTAVVNLINSFNPGYLIIGDEMAHILPDLMHQRILENVKARLVPAVYDNTRIMMSMVERDSMVHGAAVVAIREVFAHCSTFFNPGEEEE